MQKQHRKKKENRDVEEKNVEEGICNTLCGSSCFVSFPNLHILICLNYIHSPLLFLPSFPPSTTPWPTQPLVSPPPKSNTFFSPLPAPSHSPTAWTQVSPPRTLLARVESMFSVYTHAQP